MDCLTLEIIRLYNTNSIGTNTTTAVQMAILHSLRCLRTVCKGYYQRQQFLKQNQNTIESLKRQGKYNELSLLGVETCMKMYIGYRLIDVYGHVNNARYLEIGELARWHQIGLIHGLPTMWRAGLFPYVSSVSVQYMRQINPGTIVNVYTQTILSSDMTICALQRIEGLPRKGETSGTVYAAMAVRLVFVNLPIEPSDPVLKELKNTTSGPIPVHEALVRLGLKAEDFKQLMVTPKVNVTPSSCDAKSEETYDSDVPGPLPTVNEAITDAVFPGDILMNLNNRDTEWRRKLTLLRRTK